MRKIILSSFLVAAAVFQARNFPPDSGLLTTSALAFLASILTYVQFRYAWEWHAPVGIVARFSDKYLTPIPALAFPFQINFLLSGESTVHLGIPSAMLVLIAYGLLVLSAGENISAKAGIPMPGNLEQQLLFWGKKDSGDASYFVAIAAITLIVATLAYFF